MRTLPTSLVLSLLLTLTVALANVAEAGECTAQGCKARIKKLYQRTAGGDVLVEMVVPPAPGLPNCTPVSDIFLSVAVSSLQWKETYALLLAAHSLGDEVYLRTNDGSSGCTVAYVTWER